jgi:hypothetical protein
MSPETKPKLSCVYDPGAACTRASGHRALVGGSPAQRENVQPPEVVALANTDWHARVVARSNRVHRPSAPRALAIRILLVPLGVWAILNISAWWLIVASSVTVTPTAIAGKMFIGPTTRIEWEDVAKVELVPRVTDLGGEISKLVRVVGRRSSTSIVFTDAIENFAELLEMIRNRATHATSLPLVWRVLLTR